MFQCISQCQSVVVRIIMFFSASGSIMLKKVMSTAVKSIFPNSFMFFSSQNIFLTRVTENLLTFVLNYSKCVCWCGTGYVWAEWILGHLLDNLGTGCLVYKQADVQWNLCQALKLNTGLQDIEINEKL